MNDEIGADIDRTSVVPAPYRILRKRLLAGAREAEGIPVVIDVFRAFTSAAAMMHLGAERIVLLADPDAVLERKAEKGWLAVGEIGGKREHFPPSDPIYCLQRDLFDFVAVAAREGADLVARRIDIRKPEKETT